MIYFAKFPNVARVSVTALISHAFRNGHGFHRRITRSTKIAAAGAEELVKDIVKDALGPLYTVLREVEMGMTKDIAISGRADIVAIPVRDKDPIVVIEVKRSPAKNSETIAKGIVQVAFYANWLQKKFNKPVIPYVAVVLDDSGPIVEFIEVSQKIINAVENTDKRNLSHVLAFVLKALQNEITIRNLFKEVKYD